MWGINEGVIQTAAGESPLCKDCKGEFTVFKHTYIFDFSNRDLLQLKIANTVLPKILLEKTCICVYP